MINTVNKALQLIDNKYFIVYYSILNLIVSLSDLISISLISGLILKISLSNYDNPIFQIIDKIDFKILLIVLPIIFLIKILIVSYISYQIKHYIEDQNRKIKIKIANKLINEKILSFKFSEINSIFLIQSENFKGLFLEPVLFLVSNLILALCFFIFLLSINFNLTLISTIFFIFFGIIYNLTFRKYLQKLGTKTIKFFFRFSQNLNGYINTILELKFYQKNLILINQINKSLNHIKKLNAVQAIFINLPKLYFEFISIIYFVIFIYVGSILSKDNTVFSTLIIFALAFFRVLPSINAISSFLQTLNFSKKNVEILFNLIEPQKKKTIEKIVNLENIDKKISKIELKNLEYFFGTKKIINNLNFTFLRGNSYLIFGQSGSGKTTLINIIAGLIKATSGEVIFYDEDNKPCNFNNSISIVPPNIGIFNDTVANNITLFGNAKKLNIKLINKILRLNDISKKNFQNYKITESGKNLSQGQKQRIGIARSIYFDKQIQIFDESTNSVDKKIQNNFIKFLEKYKKDKIIILISHDKNLKKCVDKVINL